MNDAAVKRPLLAPAVVARMLDVSRSTAERLMSRGEIPSRNLASAGKRAMWRTTEEAVLAWLPTQDGQFDRATTIPEPVTQRTRTPRAGGYRDWKRTPEARATSQPQAQP